ncbi:tape measure protein [Xanthomonas phage Langgrundblatt1]|uniref:Tape measure protein n=1 Tax=Xanthomonas phage Langgrundblatt1 TaxID=2939128 RepID=A0A9E7J526_9CAUD|nr:tape measure protein [Xanthomonas phage Langgrundblatt1]URA06806.1 tape measure protein [Xanthomonas phage Langgrundblatt1]
MSDQPVVIEVKDGVDKNISRNLSEISSQARGAYQNVAKLVTQLNRVKPTAIAQFNSVVTNAQKQMSNAAMSAQRLATETQKTSAAAANAASAEQRLATATARAAQAQSNAAGAALRLDAAQQRAAASADRQAAASARAAQAASQQARSLAANEREIQTITGIHDRFDAVLARNPKYQQAFAKNLGETAKKAGLARHELINLSYQLNDVAVGFASGQKPLTIFAQQGAQIGQILGTSGVGLGAVLRQLGAIVMRFVPMLAILGAAVGAVAAPFSLFTREFNKGVDPKKLVDGLKLTEDQLKQLKKSGEETKITFGDTFKATFQVIGRYATDYLKPVTDWVVKWWNIALDWITKAFSVWIRVQLGMWLSLANVIKAVWKDIPAALELAAKQGVNAAITAIEFGINQISAALVGSPLGKLLGIDGPVEFKLPRLELSDDAKSMQTDVRDAIVNGYKQADQIVTKFGNDVRAQALRNAQDRIRKAAGEDDSAGKKGRKGFDRAKELAQINAELDTQAKNMFVLATARDAANRADEIALRFAKEGQPLRQEEIDALRNKIQALNDAKDVQTQFDRIYQNATGPLREYNASLAAADKLIKMGAISQAQYNAEIARAKDAFAAASDPLHDMNKELDEQIKLLGMLGPQREVEQQVMQAMNKALQEGKPLREEELNALREKLKLVQQLNIVSSMRDELQQGSQAQQSVNRATRTQTAIGEVGNNGFTGGDAVSALATDNPALEATAEFQQAQIASYTDMYAQIDALRQQDVISETSALQAKMALFQQQYQTQIQGATTALGALATLQNSQNKKQAAIGKKAAIAQTVINTYQSATAAFSAMAGIPYIGPILGAAAAAAAIAAGMANVQQIRAQNAGFKEGGYTGNLPTNSIAGPVHGQEYVFDAPSTARIGVGNLEALRRGRLPVEALGRGQSDAAEVSAAPVRMSGGDIAYNQTVNVTVAGKRDRRTAEQEARAIRRETTKELVRSGG